MALDATTEQPVQVIETIGTTHDGPISEKLANKDYILVQDRAYSFRSSIWLINKRGIM